MKPWNKIRWQAANARLAQSIERDFLAWWEAQITMKAYYDDQDIDLTDEFVEALKNLMRAEVEMMKANFPEDAEMWHWGRCEIGDLASVTGLSFEFGSQEDLPPDRLGQFGIIILDRNV